MVTKTTLKALAGAFPTDAVRALLAAAMTPLAPRPQAAPPLVRPEPDRPPPQRPYKAPVVRRKARLPRQGLGKPYRVLRQSTFGRRSGWRQHMIHIVSQHTDTLSASKAHTDSGLYVGQTLEWGWLTRKGYITFEGEV